MNKITISAYDIKGDGEVPQPLAIDLTEPEMNIALADRELAPTIQNIIDNCTRLMRYWAANPRERDWESEQVIREIVALAIAKVKRRVQEIIGHSDIDL